MDAARRCAPANVGAMALRLDPGPLPAQIRVLALATTDRCLELLGDGQPDPSLSIHECRKRLKGLRALLRACRPGLSGKEFAAQDARLRDAGRRLAFWRGRSAQRLALSGVAEHFGLPEPEHAAVSSGLGENVLRALEQESAAERAAARRLLEQSRDAMPHWLSDLDADEVGNVLARGILRTWKRARAEYRRARERPTSDQVHRWRKHVKYHLHQLQLGAGEGRRFHERIRELQGLAELLGEAHDLVDLRRTLAEGRGFVEGDPNWDALLLAREAELTFEAFEWGARLFSRIPRHAREHLREALEAPR